uniref:Uncharacterized protein n=1 Tax=Rhizophora mucronata TaxID=61149 RepID=A0A2P2PZX3_RHIMU
MRSLLILSYERRPKRDFKLSRLDIILLIRSKGLTRAKTVVSR